MALKLLLKKKNILWGLLLLFLLMQVIPVFERTNPPVIQEPPWDSARTRELVARACFDCHSNQTHWPWYSQIAPVRWLLVDDVEDARATFNLSDWHSGDISGQKAANRIAKGEMPLPRYLWLHPEARLNDSEKKQLILGVQASFK